jgi:Response regulator containing a CheY-like receiver domain and an HTH DNA-binding domain
MGLDEKTIRNHLTEIYRQLGIRSRYDLKTQVNKKIFLVAKSDTNL